MPAHLYANEHVSIRVLTETIHFDANGRGSLETAREVQNFAGGPAESITGDWAFGYKIVDQHIEVAFDCPDNALCVAPPHIVLRPTSDGLRAIAALGARTPLTFSRLSSASR